MDTRVGSGAGGLPRRSAGAALAVGLAATAALAACQSTGSPDAGRRGTPLTLLDAGQLQQVQAAVMERLPNATGAQFPGYMAQRDDGLITVCGHVVAPGVGSPPGSPIPYIGGFAGRGFFLVTLGDTEIAAKNTLEGCRKRGLPIDTAAPVIASAR